VAEINDQEVVFNAMEETCKKTTLSHLKVGQKVSIERSACYGAEMGGHPMFGHVYGTADVIDRDETENNLKLVFKCSPDVMEYIFNKGFVGINGSSLTVNDVDLGKNTFAVNLIPHTLKKTDFSNKNIGDKVNIELDANTVTIVDTIKRLNLPEQLLEKKNR
jgi:riboflavin synthase